MDNMIKLEAYFELLNSKDNTLRYEAFKKLMEITGKEVSWVYDYWQELVDKLDSPNSFQRSIGYLLLANLTLSDTENRFEELLDRYIGSFEDEKFISSRQCIQHAWKIAVNKPGYKDAVVEALLKTYTANIHLSRNPGLIKQDVVFSLQKICEKTEDQKLQGIICQLINSETDKKLSKSLKSIAGNY